MKYLQKKKIIHRDVKPDNLMLQYNGYIKVIDFGTSDKLAKGKMFKQQIGTPLYIAPEVLNNNYNEKCDLWSLGVNIYQLYTKKYPYFARFEMGILKEY